MKNKLCKKIIQVLFFLLVGLVVKAQSNQGNLSGNFQVDAQMYQTDSAHSAYAPSNKMGLNSFANLNYTYGNFTAGLRYEGYMNAMLGFDQQYNGVGIPYRFLTYQNDGLEVTVGNFYDQFGSGLIFRSYEDKSLGIDNAMDGIKIKFNPFKGIYLKGFTGKQRLYFDYGPGIVRGVDGEVFINDLIPSLTDNTTKYSIGGNFISKFQKDEDPIYNLPENVGAFSNRIGVVHKGFNLSGEYAYKYPDPSSDNGYNIKYGDAILLNASYSEEGLGIYVSAKRIDNMSFRSDINAQQNNLQINYIPAITKTHVYSLAAMYPYATQPNGEVGFQAEVSYNFKPESMLGGKYGTNLLVNFSRVHNLKTKLTADATKYTSDYLAIGDELYFQDINLKIYKKFSSKLKADFSYINLIYNKDKVQGLSGYGTINANIGIADITYKFKPRHALRFELQGLFTEQGKGNWAMGLIEYTFAPTWFISASDEYNYGNEKDKLHYYYVSAGYKKGANKFQLGYGFKRDGLDCSGGTCRYVPASYGLTLSITSTF